MKHIICIAGPTASGKSATVETLAAHLPIEIINVDSATIYRGMDIGTAKPSAEERKRIRHHLLDIRDPLERYSVADFYHDTLALIQEIQERGKLPILLGGTMMYYNALREGLHDLPCADPDIRIALEKEALEKGWHHLHQKLHQADPITAQRLSPNDSQRIQRALEVIAITGKPLSTLFAEQKAMQAPYHFLTISLEPEDRRDLHHRIAQRFMQMMEQGLIEEVNALYQRGDLHLDLPSIRCVGYRQLWQYLEGKTSKALAIEQAIAATRQLAKRQLTWLRSQENRIVINAFSQHVPKQVLDKIKPYIQ